MNQLPDAIGGKGYANILPPVNIPKFDNITALQSKGNDMQLQYAKLAADQRAKAAALAQKQAQLDAKAKDVQLKATAKKQADMYKVLNPETDPLMGDAPKWAAEAYGNMLKEAKELSNKGIDINSFETEAVAFRSGTLLNYHANYKKHAQIAKTFLEKQKQWSEKSDEYEPYSLADGDIVPYNKTGWDGNYYASSLVPKVGVATIDDVNKYEGAMLGESEYSKDLSKKAKGYIGNDPIREKTESYMARDFQGLADDVNYNLRHSGDKKQREQYKFYQQQASASKQIDATTGDIMLEYFLDREKTTRKKGGTDDVIISQPEKEGNEKGYYSGWNGNTMVLGKGNKQHTIAFNPNGADVRAGSITNLMNSPDGTPDEGDLYYQSVGSTSVAGGALAGDKMLENSAWVVGKLDEKGRAIPFNGDAGTINTDQLLIFPINERGEMIGVLRNKKGQAEPPRTGYERYNLFAKAITPKVGKEGGETVFVNLHNAFPAEMESRGMRTSFTDEEARKWVGQSATPKAEVKDKKAVTAPGMNPIRLGNVDMSKVGKK